MPEYRQDGKLTSREVAQKLKRDVEQFQSRVESELKAIVQRAENLGASWQDAQYSQFLGYIGELTSALRTDVSQLENAVDAINREL